MGNITYTKGVFVRSDAAFLTLGAVPAPQPMPTECWYRMLRISTLRQTFLIICQVLLLSDSDLSCQWIQNFPFLLSFTHLHMRSLFLLCQLHLLLMSNVLAMPPPFTLIDVHVLLLQSLLLSPLFMQSIDVLSLHLSHLSANSSSNTLPHIAYHFSLFLIKCGMQN